MKGVFMPQKYSGLFYMRINKLEKIHTSWGERWIVAEAKLLSSEFMIRCYLICTYVTCILRNIAGNKMKMLENLKSISESVLMSDAENR